MAATAGSRTMEITVLSAEGLTVDRKPVTKSVFVEVRAESINCFTTAPATAYGGYPSWNETLTVEVPAHAMSIVFEVKSKASMGDKSVGIARLALSDFLGGFVPENCLQFLSYRLRSWDGRRNGIVNFSVRVKSPAPEYNYSIPVPVRGTALGERISCGCQMRVPMGDQKSSHGVVTGIPVSWNNHSHP